MIKSWDKSLETGNEQIDNQHRELIKLIDYLNEPQRNDDDVLKLLDKVFEFTVVHFLSEEELMRRVNYPPDEIKVMVEQHHEFKSYVRLRILEFRLGRKLDIKSFKLFVENFLKVHEFGLDRRLADWIRFQKEKTSSKKSA
jgi:hemerythrin